jgi:hypothetical protein
MYIVYIVSHQISNSKQKKPINFTKINKIKKNMLIIKLMS